MEKYLKAGARPRVANKARGCGVPRWLNFAWRFENPGPILELSPKIQKSRGESDIRFFFAGTCRGASPQVSSQALGRVTLGAD